MRILDWIGNCATDTRNAISAVAHNEINKMAEDITTVANIYTSNIYEASSWENRYWF